MLLINEFIDKLRPYLKTLPSEPVEINRCIGRIIAKDVIARNSLPTQDIATLTGYAINADEIKSIPLQFKKIGRSYNNKPYNGKKPNGQEAILVFSGVPIPAGTNAIIPEYEVENNENYITVNDFISKGANVAHKGIDIQSGDVIFKTGTLITSRHVAQAAFIKLPWLPVVRQPKIGIMVSPEENLQDENSLYQNEALISSLSALISACGAVGIDLGTAIDMRSPIEDVVTFKQEAKFAIQNMDLLVIVGGTLDPNNSLLWTTLHQYGAKLDQQSVNIGGTQHNIVEGAVGNIPIIGFPGDVVLMMMAGIIFLCPVIFHIMGRDFTKSFDKKVGLLSRNLDVYDLQSDFLYAYLNENANGELMVTPVSAQDCLMLSSFTKADCIAIVDKTKELKANTPVDIIMTSNSGIKT